MCEISRLRRRLRDHYREKRAFYQEEFPDFFDADLKRIFSVESSAGAEKASRLIEKHKKKLMNSLTAWTRAKKYTINGLLKRLTARCDHLNLRLAKSEAESILELGTYLTALVTNYLYTGKFKRTRSR